MLGDTQRHEVPGLLQRDAHGHRATEGTFEITRPPAAFRRIDNDRRVHEALAWRDSLLQRRQVDHWLEAGTWLAVGLCGAVELALLEAPAADHGQHAAGLRVQRNQSA